MTAPAEPDALELDRDASSDRKRQIELLKGRVEGFKDSGGEKIDLRRVDPAIYGVPPRHDTSGPAQLAWDRAFSLPLVAEPFTFPLEFDQPLILRRQLKTVASSPSRFETSRNWSGAYITANEGRHFGQIWGFWQIPPTLAVPPPPFEGDSALPYYAVNWIGLDGQRNYLDSSLPQIGTQAQLDPDGVTVTATTWMQWWANNDVHTLGPLPIGLAAKPGDFMAAVLTVIDCRTVWGAMVNLSTRQFGSRKMVAPTVTLNGNDVRPSIEGATAEWIMERSEVPGQQVQNNLANYGATEFDLCVAIEAPKASLFSLLHGIPQVLSGARLIRMIYRLNNPARTAYISMPEKVNEWTLRIRFGGFPG